MQIVDHEQAQRLGIGAHQIGQQGQQLQLTRVLARQPMPVPLRVVGDAHQIVHEGRVGGVGVAGTLQRRIDAPTQVVRRQIGRGAQTQGCHHFARRPQRQGVTERVDLDPDHARTDVLAAAREFGAQARLATAGLAADAHDLALAGARAAQRVHQLRHLVAAADEAPGTRGRVGHRCAADVQAQREQRHGMGDALQGKAADRPRRQQARAQQVARLLGQQHLAGIGLRGHAAGQVDGHAVRAAAAPVAGLGRVRGHLAGVQPHAQRQAGAPLHGVESLLHARRRQAGLLGVLLQRQGYAEQGHDAVAQGAQHGAVVLLDDAHDALDGGLQPLHGLLRAELGNLPGGIDDVGKQDGRRLDFTPVARRRRGGSGQRLSARGAKAVGWAAGRMAMGAETAGHRSGAVRPQARRGCVQNRKQRRHVRMLTALDGSAPTLRGRFCHPSREG